MEQANKQAAQADGQKTDTSKQGKKNEKKEEEVLVRSYSYLTSVIHDSPT
jgi:hypothetical protein